jgi:hypothetical protein
MVSKPNDLARQLVVTLSLVACILGSMLGAGVFGGPPVAEAAGGALAADATRIAPGSGAFTIWFVVYVGLAVYTVWQWLPAQRESERHRTSGWWIAASMLLNAAWLLTVRQGWLWLSVVVIFVLVGVLGTIVSRLAQDGPTTSLDRLITDGTMGVYMGWVAVATCANVTAALVASGVDPSAGVAASAAVVVLAVAALVGAVLALVTNANWGIALAMTWGLVWIAIARWGGEPHSSVTGFAAVLAALAVVAATGFVAARRGPAVGPV